jgi:hypothetical protein
MNPPTYTLEQAEELRKSGQADLVDYAGERALFLVTREAVYERTNNHYQYFGRVREPVRMPLPKFVLNSEFRETDLSREGGYV